MSNSDAASLTDGLFYGGIAYVFSYLYVYLDLLRGPGGFCKRVGSINGVEDIISQPSASVKFLYLVFEKACDVTGISGATVPTWKYAGWVYHYSKGGTITSTFNYMPGSVSIPGVFMFPPGYGPALAVREKVLYKPWQLPEVVSVKLGGFTVGGSPATSEIAITIGGSSMSSEVVNIFSAYHSLGIVTVTPTALFVAGAIVAYRNDEMTPIGGAIAGSKVTAGFLLLSIVGVYLFEVTISGLTFSASLTGQLDLAPEVGPILGGSVGGEYDLVFTTGPSLGRAVLSGTVYPLLFGVAGGAAGGQLGAAKSVFKATKFGDVLERIL
jgi:hypothetical protein